MSAADREFEKLQKRLTALLPLAAPFSGVVFRSCTPRYATETELLSGVGSQQFGGRWNSIGLATVYASLTPETAMAEPLAQHRYFSIPISDALPRTFVALSVKLQVVLDLREGEIRRRLQVAKDRLRDVDWRAEMQSGRQPLTQQLGKAADSAGYEGLVVPSAEVHTGCNLVIFPARIRTGSHVVVMNADRLAN